MGEAGDSAPSTCMSHMPTPEAGTMVGDGRMLVGFRQPVSGIGVNFPPKPTDAVRARGEDTDAGEAADTFVLQIHGRTEKLREGGNSRRVLGYLVVEWRLEARLMFLYSEICPDIKCSSSSASAESVPSCWSEAGQEEQSKISGAREGSPASRGDQTCQGITFFWVVALRIQSSTSTH